MYVPSKQELAKRQKRAENAVFKELSKDFSIHIIKPKPMKINYKLIAVAVVVVVFIVLASCQGCQVQKLKKQNAEYKEQNEQFKQSNEALRAKIDSLGKVCDDFKTENAVFKESNEILAQSLNDMKIENANFIVENNKLKAHIAEMDNLSKAFDSLLQRLKKEVDRLEKIER